MNNWLAQYSRIAKDNISRRIILQLMGDLLAA